MRLIQSFLPLAGPIFLATLLVQSQPAPIYANFGSVPDAGQIDARIFYNSGDFNASGGFSVGGPIPYQTMHTHFWTNANSGVMNSFSGFLFDYATPTNRLASSLFVNRGDIFGGSHLVANATNLINSGFLSTTREGLIILQGETVNLTRGGLQVSEFTRGGAFPSPGDGATNFTSTVGVDAQWGGVGTNGVIDAGQGGGGGNPLDVTVFVPPGPSSGPHQVVTAGGFTNNVNVPQFPGEYSGYMNTNMVDATNTIVQMVFVNKDNPDTNFNVQVKFGSSNNPAQDVFVEFSLTDTNIVTGDPVTNFVYFVDRSATLARTNLFLKTNTDGGAPKPNGYSIWRSTPPGLLNAADPNTRFEQEFVTGSAFPNTTVTNIYLGYSATIDAGITGGGGGGFFFGGADDPFDGFSKIDAVNDPTNGPGRITIKADQLDLSGTRLRASGIVSIDAEEYVGAPPFGIDTSLLTLNLKSASGSGLKIDNIVKDTVKRLSGRVNAWTGIYTNNMEIVTDDTTVDPPVTTTNFIAFQYNVLIVEGNFTTDVAVQVRDFNLVGDSVEVVDNIRVNRNFLIDSPDVTLSGGFLGISTDIFGKDQMPNTVNFTNTGTISLNNKVNFGNDRAFPYENFINSGTIFASSIDIDSTWIRNEEVILTDVGAITIKAETMENDGGVIESWANTTIKATDFLSLNSGLLTGTNSNSQASGFASLILDVSGRLEDAGPDAGNLWQFSDGIKVLQRPASGDLLGTTMISVGPRFQEVTHVWPAEDRGATAAGFTDNLAVGTMVLNGDRFSLFTFEGTGTDNAIYIDMLQFDNYATNWMDSINIAENMTVYFANSNISVDELNGAFDGRLVWVSDFAGPSSGMSVNGANGVTLHVNRALVTSTTEDSDGDGIVNAEDIDPFGLNSSDGITLYGSVDESSNVLTFEALPGVTYEAQYTENIDSGSWLLLKEVTNTGSSAQTITIVDPIPDGEGHRFYRVVQK